MTNESALLGLLADLYRQVTALQAENAQLHEALAQRPPNDGTAGATVTPITAPSGGSGSIAMALGALADTTSSVALGWPPA